MAADERENLINNVDDISRDFRDNLHHSVPTSQCAFFAVEAKVVLRRSVVQGTHPEDLQRRTNRVVSHRLCNPSGFKSFRAPVRICETPKRNKAFVDSINLHSRAHKFKSATSLHRRVGGEENSRNKNR